LVVIELDVAVVVVVVVVDRGATSSSTNLAFLLKE